MEFVGAVLLMWITAGIVVVMVLNAVRWLVRRHTVPACGDLGDAARRVDAPEGRSLPRPLPRPVRPVVARSSLTRPVPAAPEL